MQTKIQKILVNIYVIYKYYKLTFFQHFFLYIILLYLMSLFFRIIVDRIKQNFLLKKFKKSVTDNEILKDLYDISTQKYSFFMTETEQINERFDDISKYISRKNVIYEITQILNNYYRWNKINENNFFKLNAHQFLIAWLIYYCPTIILGEINTDEKKYVFYNTKKIIDLIYDIYNNKIINMIEFNKIFLSYTDSLIVYLEKDKIDKINYYTAEWISLDKSYDSINSSNKYTYEQKDIILKNIDNDKKMIEKYINKMCKNFDYKRLKLIINMSNNISKKIIDNYKKIIEEDIISKKFDISKKILDDIKKFILMFNRKKEAIDKINDTIDGDYFIQLITNNIIDMNDIKLFGDYIVQNICGIGSVTCETESMKEWNKLKNKYDNQKDKYKLIADMLIFILDMIDIIRNELLDYEFLLQHIYSNK